jgi:hypothetical protein
MSYFFRLDAGDQILTPSETTSLLAFYYFLAFQKAEKKDSNIQH